MGAIAISAKRYRAGGGGPSLRTELAETVRGSVKGALIALGARGAEIDDVAQEVTQAVLDRIERGEIAPGREDSYARTCARNGWISHVRRKWTRDVILLGDEPEGETPEGDIVSALDRPTLLRCLGQALAAAPAAYREVLEEVYLAERGIDELADEELARRQDDPSDEEARKRARNTVDARLSRARLWVKRRLLAFLGEEEDAS
jgi:DNA-directed RNA polymerase specialized sigma24 family protein